ncbi:hypothetical protein [Streptococcus danieliae]|uniref:Uncharacterized protein n=1 Tax=Streptococcus danieliae TaxID=747656 RepID=A0A7Z0M7P7_9STRE|nr:hypothetical protein [Streptococcus danieliae]MBF0700151.1 hypothetical protein [Streptococcus danieliae]NYS97327.1 hypothetical protein [Streptococcus danieliae]
MKKLLSVLAVAVLVLGGWLLFETNQVSSQSGSSSFQLFGSVDLENNQGEEEVGEDTDSSEEDDAFGNFIEEHETPLSKRIVIEDSSEK